jgi:hypothetical protein
MIKPTPGRVVWYYEAGLTTPQAAIVAFVHSDTMVNLTAFDYNGTPKGVTSVPLLQGDSDIPSTPYATWMPYQVGQAAKTEELQKQIAETKV